jgi:diadenosine tetraphosphate (Ap4A) HIT family hydrolase
MLDKYPVNEGHALVLPKDHIQYLQDADWKQLTAFLEEAIAEVRNRYDPDALNIGINDGPEAGQTIPHLHWHIIPRYDGDMPDPAGGVRGVIPEEQTYD